MPAEKVRDNGWPMALNRRIGKRSNQKLKSGENNAIFGQYIQPHKALETHHQESEEYVYILDFRIYQ